MAVENKPQTSNKALVKKNTMIDGGAKNASSSKKSVGVVGSQKSLKSISNTSVAKPVKEADRKLNLKEIKAAAKGSNQAEIETENKSEKMKENLNQLIKSKNQSNKSVPKHDMGLEEALSKIESADDRHLVEHNDELKNYSSKGVLQLKENINNPSDRNLITANFKDNFDINNTGPYSSSTKNQGFSRANINDGFDTGKFGDLNNLHNEMNDRYNHDFQEDNYHQVMPAELNDHGDEVILGELQQERPNSNIDITKSYKNKRDLIPNIIEKITLSSVNDGFLKNKYKIIVDSYCFNA